VNDIARVRALRVPVDAPPTVEEIVANLSTYQLLVGGHAKALHPCGSWHLYYSPCCRVAGIDANLLANTLLRKADPSFADILCGPVVFVGTADDGREVDVPKALLRMVETLDPYRVS